ncbi:SAM-dependent methyltransferase [Adhaeribacter aerolatus]|uniref:SAM-dependent methyltransferase n=1 Tax=Adhaeribacter aerolatus TaxID=670289 RepID=A0A512B513_9BACT|nr:class I SAM-dependent methyltransferase [Adhaeribacter aerolatus]GEO06867.1 SAM-dependent methyltransferase [Adhaeribacter aerolatus]
MSTFDYYAAYYDLLYKDKDYAGEVDYLYTLIKKHSPTAKNILDFGCGTGKHDFLLAERGFQVFGVDLSEKMISEANQNKSRNNLNVNFCQGDIRNIRLNQTFDIVTCLFHVINYQITNEDLLKTFETAKVHLKPNGLFIFDSWYGPGVLTDLPERRIKDMEDARISVERIAEPILHLNQNMVDVNYTLQIKDKIHHNSQIIREQHRMRFLFYPEIEMLAQLNGFEVIGFEKWLQGGIPHSNWFVTVVCRVK